MTAAGDSSGPLVLFRVDASPRMGGGHLMRCLNLADALAARGARIGFACAAIPTDLARRLQDSPYALHRIEPTPESQCEGEGWDSAILGDDAQRLDAERTVTVAGAKPDWLVLDHYRFDRRWLSHSRGKAGRLLVIDDLANRPLDCDLLVDQTFGRDRADYASLVSAEARLLVGARYAMIGNEFHGLRPAALARRAEAGPVRRLLIALGSTDVDGVTGRVLELVLDADPRCDIDVVVGAAAQSAARIEELARTDPRITAHVDTREMPALIAGADLAIGAAGVSAWERCCLGLPAITLVLADNQRLVGRKLHEAGAIELAETPDRIGEVFGRVSGDEGARFRLIAAAAAIVDGLGCARVVDAMLGGGPPLNPARLSLRDAGPGDAQDVWLWRNDPDTRAASQSRAPVAWPDHLAWWDRALASPERHLLIGEIASRPIGMVRFDPCAGSDPAYEASINIDPAARGAGLGSSLLRAGCVQFLGIAGPTRLEAVIQPGNFASRRIFEGLGFVRRGPLGEGGFDRYVLPAGQPIESAQGASS